ncbi:MAG: N-6 DNA methylase [Chloroflexi bacterium]|nr:N-6 DNA methylase [Chloroflexota bacterium]
MTTLNLKPNHKAVKDYYDALNALTALGTSHEGAVSPSFAALLRHCAHQYDWTLIEKHSVKRNGHTIIVDGALADAFKLVHGYWEAKDSHDDLDKEIKKKFAVGYPKDNILFQAPHRVIIWQDARQVLDEDITQPERLIEALRTFFAYQPPAYEQFEQAVEEFKLKVPELASALLQLIEKERASNQRFIQAFEGFSTLCRQTINPNISTQAVEEMLIQHLLTERIFRSVFNNPDFVERNVIAREIEKVIVALTSQSFSKHEFQQSLDRFYGAIETTAATIEDFSQKQGFLNTVYEKFFQGFSVKVADTRGIVYTPQPIVQFMVKSVQEILRKEFGRSLSDPGVHIIDPFVGTGSFIVRVMREMQKSRLPYKYANELHCNEVILLPYYIASMNIEHEYYELTGMYQPFQGVCLVDTFELAEGKQLPLMTEENTARVKRQQEMPIFVVIGNPPYNAGQVNENDNNKNRKYPAIDGRVSRTYGKASQATLLRKLSDPYVKAIRWASDRIGDEGIVAFVTNSSIVTELTFDGMRSCLESDFDAIYVLDLGGNVRKNQKLSGTTHNVFGIQLGVSINLLVKRKTALPRQARIHYARLDEFWRKEEKYDFLDEKQHIGNVVWEEKKPDASHNWLTEGMSTAFESFLSLGTKETKGSKGINAEAIFKLFSLGVGTNRDEWVYDFQRSSLDNKVTRLIHNYNLEVARFSEEGTGEDIDQFVNNDPNYIKWTDRLKEALRHHQNLTHDAEKVRYSMYRPFTRQALYFDPLLNQRRYRQSVIFPTQPTEAENQVVCMPSVGGRTPFWCLCVGLIPNLTLTSVDANQCFPFYVYGEDGSNRRENITDWALEQFRTHYHDDRISKWDIFHYIYAVLHHPQYRERYAANLRRELPRIPYAPDFWRFAEAGAKLADLHLNYEKHPEYPLQRLENKDVRLNWRVERMRLAKDKRQLAYNDFLTLGGIPPEVFEYRLGNRSALEWIIDQYQVSTDKRSGMVNDPNRTDDPEYIVRLIGKVTTVSLDTVRIVTELPVLE